MPIYLDNAATTFPKPANVITAVETTLRCCAANPGRGGHQLSLQAARLVMECRETVARFFGIPDAARIAFTNNATEAINLALFGALKPGDRVVTTTMEHNAVIRPLHALSEQGVDVVRVQADGQGFVDPASIRAACSKTTRLVTMTHCSNVTGTVQAIEEIGPWCRNRGILFMVDAAQSAGILPIDVEEMSIDLLAVPGHKSLFGPSGTGFLYVSQGLDLRPLLYGGTGNFSQSATQPLEMPERLESGTLNTIGLAGLMAGIQYLEEVGLDKVRSHEQALVSLLRDGIGCHEQAIIYGPSDSTWHAGALSFNIKNIDAATLGFRLDREYDICCRVGLHCAPEAHTSIGTLASGTVRLSPGFFNTAADIKNTIAALGEIIASHH